MWCLLVLCLDPGRKVLDGSSQELHFLKLSLVGGSECGDLRLKSGDILLHGGKAGYHRSLYLCQGIFQIVVDVVRSFRYWSGGAYVRALSW